MAEAPKIHIDSDWKAEAQKEKERLAQKEQDRPKAPGAPGTADGEREPLPPAEFHTLVGMLAQQAIMGLGVMADRKTGGVIVDLEGSRFSIDLLDVLQQKTKGNLSAEEEQELTQILADLRTRFVQIAALVKEQVTKQGTGGVAIATPSAIPQAPGQSPNPIITD